MTMQLGDDGTLDTVIVCSECREELRYNFDPEMAEGTTETDEGDAYDQFVAWALEDAASEHECDSHDRTLPIETPAETMTDIVHGKL